MDKKFGYFTKKIYEWQIKTWKHAQNIIAIKEMQIKITVSITH